MRKWSAVCNGCPISDFAVGTMPACSDCFNYGGALSENESLAKELAQSEVVVKGVYNGVLDFYVDYGFASSIYDDWFWKIFYEKGSNRNSIKKEF